MALNDQKDLSNATLLPESVSLGSVPKREPATDRQNKLAIAQVIEKLSHFGRVRLRQHPGNFHLRIHRGFTIR